MMQSTLPPPSIALTCSSIIGGRACRTNTYDPLKSDMVCSLEITEWTDTVEECLEAFTAPEKLGACT